MKQGGLVEQSLAMKPPFPEPPLTAIFLIGVSGNLLVEIADEAADVGEIVPPGHEPGFDFHLLRFSDLTPVSEVDHQRVRSIDEMIPVNDLKISQAVEKIQIDMENDMVVIGHDGIGDDIDAKSLAEFDEAILDPRSSVFETSPRAFIGATQIGLSYAFGGAVVVRGGFEVDGDTSGICHG